MKNKLNQNKEFKIKWLLNFYCYFFTAVRTNYKNLFTINIIFAWISLKIFNLFQKI